MLILLSEYQAVRSPSGKSFTQTGGKVRDHLPLREHRVRAGVELEAIVESTKLSRRFLCAIEEGRYQELPGGVFTINYIRQYAEATGYDADLILEHYRQTTDGGWEPEASTGTKATAVRWNRFALFG
jgi:cytoskeletal protein RodZ